MKKKCIICGFDKRTHEHHIIKRRDCGADDEENKITLCPNHHWIADFGTLNDRKEILRLIKEITGKEGKKISKEESKLLDDKVIALSKEWWGKMDEEFWIQFRDTWNYENTQIMLLGRNCKPIFSALLNERAEKLILINNKEDKRGDQKTSLPQE